MQRKEEGLDSEHSGGTLPSPHLGQGTNMVQWPEASQGVGEPLLVASVF